MAKKPKSNQKKLTQPIIGKTRVKLKEIDININVNLDDSRNNNAVLSEQRIRIRTKLTVQQLAYLFRVLNKMGLVESSSQTNILKFISETFETDNVADISVKSLRSKYYSLEKKARAATREQLMQIVHFIDNDTPTP
jgi:hypothetical protein